MDAKTLHEVLAINSKVDSMTADEAQPSTEQRPE
jgi:hypothetical protein